MKESCETENSLEIYGKLIMPELLSGPQYGDVQFAGNPISVQDVCVNIRGGGQFIFVRMGGHDFPL